MSRLRNALLLDLKVQARYRFPQIYLLFTLLYIGALRHPVIAPLAPALLPALLFSEPGLLGMYFTAAHFYFEAGQGTTQAIAVSPLRPKEYALGKAMSIGLVATLAGVLLFGAVAGFDARLIGLAALLLATATSFGLGGLALAVGIADFHRFILLSMLLVLPALLPVLALLDLAPHVAFVWLPSAPLIYGVELLVDVGSPEPWAPAAMLVYILLAAGWALAALRWATTAYRGYSRGLSPRCRDHQRRIAG